MSSSLGAITLDSLSRGLVHCFEVSRRNGARPLMTSLPSPPPPFPTDDLSRRRPGLLGGSGGAPSLPRKRSYLFHPLLLLDLSSNNGDAIFTRGLPAGRGSVEAIEREKEKEREKGRVRGSKPSRLPRDDGVRAVKESQRDREEKARERERERRAGRMVARRSTLIV